MEEIEAPIDPPNDWWEKEDTGDDDDRPYTKAFAKLRKEFGRYFDDADDLRDIERDEELLRDE